MNEHYYSFNQNSTSAMCCVCCNTEDIRIMTPREEYWYRIIVCSVSTSFSEQKMNVCVYCGYLLKKYASFTTQCFSSYNYLSQVKQRTVRGQKLSPPKCTSKLTKTSLETHYLGSEQQDIDPQLDDVKKEDLDPIGDEINNIEDDGTVYDDDGDVEDDIPLVLLSKREDMGDGVTADGKCIAKKEGKSRSARKKGECERDGFSSRMVRETDEYTVIKLTREQVLAEMRTRSCSERYRRALYKCARCVKGFNFQDVLQAHMKAHDQTRGSFECDICHQFCPSAVSLRGHIKSHTTRYSCKVCSCVRLSRQHLLEHHAIAHAAAATTYSCDHCQFTTNKRTVMQRHARSHRTAAALRCARCPRHFRTKQALRVHLARHDKSSSVSCDECGRRFVYPSLLQRHVQAVHVDKEYYCVECDIRFKSPDNLRLHFKKAKKHRDSSSYTSEECGLAERLKCALCGRLYASKDALAAHRRRVHRGAGGDAAVEKAS